MAYTKEILTLAVEIGDTMLRNGAEIYRVEDTVVHILNSYDFSKAKDLKSYIKTITNPSSKNKNVREDLTVTKNDNILTLSTCTSTDSERYLVQSILTKITDTK